MKRIIITGGGGYLAEQFSEHLAVRGGYDVKLLSRSPRTGKEILIADIADWNADWAGTFRNAYAIVHLAACRTRGAPWADLQRVNVDGTLNVFEAAAQGKARRIIYASTSRVLEGYFNSRVRWTPALSPKPVSLYSVSKSVGESIARHFAMRRGQSVVCFRVGRCHAGDDRTDIGMTMNQQLRRLSIRDFCQAMELAIETDNIGFSLLHLASEIPGSPWDISETKRVLGYEPQDSYHPEAPSLKHRLSRVIRRRISRLSQSLMP
jgi:NAD+ dependent glucose-6-phosphate dehydrogenase